MQGKIVIMESLSDGEVCSFLYVSFELFSVCTTSRYIQSSLAFNYVLSVKAVDSMFPAYCMLVSRHEYTFQAEIALAS